MPEFKHFRTGLNSKRNIQPEEIAYCGSSEIYTGWQCNPPLFGEQAGLALKQILNG